MIQSSEDDTCSICLMPYFHPTLLQSCKHIFCQPCIDEANEMYDLKKCPLCRAAFKPTDKLFLQDKNKQMEQKYPQLFKSRIQNLKQKITYRIQIGNLTKVMQTNENNKYCWTLFVRPAPGQDPLDKYIDHVEIHLHPTFKPSIVKFKGKEKMELRRFGWGTFAIGVTINWKKPFVGFMQVSHNLEFQPLVSKFYNCKLLKQEQ